MKKFIHTVYGLYRIINLRIYFWQVKCYPLYFNKLINN